VVRQLGDEVGHREELEALSEGGVWALHGSRIGGIQLDGAVDTET
jgi:hypothetical protein